MKKTLPILLTVLMLLSLGAVAGYRLYQKTAASPGAPSIRFTSETLSVPVKATDEELLQGVTATDPEDGDVTASLIVEGMSRLSGDNNVKVSYVAFDSKNHMARAERTVHLTDYTDTRFELTSALCFAASSKINVLDRVKATDMLDGDLSDKVKYSVEGDTVNISTVGEHQLGRAVSFTRQPCRIKQLRRISDSPDLGAQHSTVYGIICYHNSSHYCISPRL